MKQELDTQLMFFHDAQLYQYNTLTCLINVPPRLLEIPKFFDPCYSTIRMAFHVPTDYRCLAPLPQSSYKMKWKTSKICFLQIFCYVFFSLCKKWPVLVVLMKSYLIILQFWATQNKFLVSHPFNSEKWSARADSNFIFYFFLYRESWMKMAWFTKPSQFAWFTKPSQFATGSEHGGIAYTFEVDNW